MTNSECCHRGFTLNPCWNACPGEYEDLDHVFRLCIKAKPIWRHFVDEAQMRSTQPLFFNEWMSWNLRKKNSSNTLNIWRDKFAICLWWIWHWRNKLIFESLEPDMRAKVEVIMRYFLIVESAMLNQPLVRGEQGAYCTRWVGWSPPQQGWMTLNSDGCVKQGPNIAGGGGLIRDHES